ncbi:hypothetical protein Mapa_009319 [Marchantia paleacea]|nr:hypothetical protein Mapa_009319 [Marchantia paleacea]
MSSMVCSIAILSSTCDNPQSKAVECSSSADRTVRTRLSLAGLRSCAIKAATD